MRWREQRGQRDTDVHAHDLDVTDLDNTDPLDRDSDGADDPHRYVADTSVRVGHRDRHDPAAFVDVHTTRSDQKRHRHGNRAPGQYPDDHGDRDGAATVHHRGHRDDDLGPDSGRCRSGRSGRRSRRVQPDRRDELHAVGLDRIRHPGGGRTRGRPHLVAAIAPL